MTSSQWLCPTVEDLPHCLAPSSFLLSAPLFLWKSLCSLRALVVTGHTATEGLSGRHSLFKLPSEFLNPKFRGIMNFPAFFCFFFLLCTCVLPQSTLFGHRMYFFPFFPVPFGRGVRQIDHPKNQSRLILCFPTNFQRFFTSQRSGGTKATGVLPTWP